MSFITPPSYPGFSTAAYTTAPNNAVNVAAVQAVGGTASVDLALLPKGLSGAILADVPDNTSIGGAKRGAQAVDLQILRTTAAQVASGQTAVIAGGGNNTASGFGAAVLGGTDNWARGLYATVGGGANNTAGAASGDQGPTVGGGYQNLANAAYATIPGGLGATVRSIIGRFSYSSYTPATVGNWQLSKLLESAVTSNATPFGMHVQGSGGGARNAASVLTVADNSANVFEGYVVARDNTTEDSSAWRVTGLIKRGAGVGTTALVGAPVVTLIAQDAGAAAWALAVSADTALGALKYTVTGAAGVTIRWLSNTEITEVGF